MSKIKHKTRFAIGDRVSYRAQPDFQGTIVAASPEGFTVAWSNGFTLSESAASLMPAGSVDKYKCEMMERHYTCTIMRDEECILATVDESCAEILTAELNALAADNERLREALTDFAEFGCRHDTNPTTQQGVGEQKCREWYTGYITSMDSGVRQRARAALDNKHHTG